MSKTAQSPAPGGTLTNRQSGEQRRAGGALTKLALQGWELHMQIAALTDQLDTVKAQLLELMDDETLEVKGHFRAVVSTVERVIIADAVELQGVLGKRFGDLVKVETQYKPEPRLIQMASDADDKLAADLRPCLKVARSRSVRFLAGAQ